MEMSLSLWQQPAADEEVAGGGDAELNSGPLLSYETRVGAAKILMELEMFDVSEI